MPAVRVATAEFQRLRLSLERLGMILSRINKRRPPTKGTA
jgi:hypothetical protein